MCIIQTEFLSVRLLNSFKFSDKVPVENDQKTVFDCFYCTMTNKICYVPFIKWNKGLKMMQGKFHRRLSSNHFLI